MFTLIVITALSAIAIASTGIALHTDGYRRLPLDPARLP